VKNNWSQEEGGKQEEREKGKKGDLKTRVDPNLDPMIHRRQQGVCVLPTECGFPTE
jgi:hypothetical protein